MCLSQAKNIRKFQILPRNNYKSIISALKLMINDRSSKFDNLRIIDEFRYLSLGNKSHHCLIDYYPL